MDSRERVIRTLNFQEVDRIPRQIWALAGVSMFRKDELDEVNKIYPQDFASPVYKYGIGKESPGKHAL